MRLMKFDESPQYLMDSLQIWWQNRRTFDAAYSNMEYEALTEWDMPMGTMISNAYLDAWYWDAIQLQLALLSDHLSENPADPRASTLDSAGQLILIKLSTLVDNALRYALRNLSNGIVQFSEMVYLVRPHMASLDDV
jgi:hypothetical protein